MASVNEGTHRRRLRAANRLHHLGIRYAGALAEVAKGEPVGFLLAGAPGLHEMRDLISLILLCRAEMNAVTKIMIETKLIDAETLTKEIAEEYERLTKEKAAELGVKVTDEGLVFTAEPPKDGKGT